MQKMLAVIILGGNLALAASAAVAGDLHEFSDKLQNGSSIAIAQEQSPSPTVDDPPAIKKFNQYRDDNMVP
jgi:hypothetical protein